MKNRQYAMLLMLLVAGSVSAQEVTKKEGVKTTKIAQKNAKQLQKEAKKSGSKTEERDANKTMDAAKRAEKQAKKNPNQ